jgi:hypothetical protein
MARLLSLEWEDTRWTLDQREVLFIILLPSFVWCAHCGQEVYTLVYIGHLVVHVSTPQEKASLVLCI